MHLVGIQRLPSECDTVMDTVCHDSLRDQLQSLECTFDITIVLFKQALAKDVMRERLSAESPLFGSVDYCSIVFFGTPLLDFDAP